MGCLGIALASSGDSNSSKSCSSNDDTVELLQQKASVHRVEAPSSQASSLKVNSTLALPTFSTCDEAKAGIMALPRKQRWNYDCAKICYWQCAGNRVCDCF